MGKKTTDNSVSENLPHTEIIIEDKTDENNILDEINYYMSLLDDIDFSDVENINENIILALPSINHGNFMNIIYGIFAQIIKYINEIKKFIS